MFTTPMSAYPAPTTPGAGFPYRGGVRQHLPGPPYGMGAGPDLPISTMVSPAAGLVTPLITGGAGIVGAAATAGITMGISAAVIGITMLINKFRLTGQQKVAATNIVDQVEPMLRQNLAAYQSSGHTITEQSETINNFYTLWNIVVQKCSDPALGRAGERCIGERREGAVPPWGGGNWFVRYLDPIRNDPNVVPDPTLSVTTVYDPNTGQPYEIVTGSAAGGSMLGIQGLNWTVLAVGAGILAVVLMGGSK